MRAIVGISSLSFWGGLRTGKLSFGHYASPGTEDHGVQWGVQGSFASMVQLEEDRTFLCGCLGHKLPLPAVLGTHDEQFSSYHGLGIIFSNVVFSLKLLQATHFSPSTIPLTLSSVADWRGELEA